MGHKESKKSGFWLKIFECLVWLFLLDEIQNNKYSASKLKKWDRFQDFRDLQG